MTDDNKEVFTVKVLCEDDVWMAFCNDLSLVAETDSYENLVDISLDIASYLYIANGLGTDPSHIKLEFVKVDKSEFDTGQTDEEFRTWLDEYVSAIDAENEKAAKQQRRTA